MKVIDILNKIANGEEAPKKIIWNKLVYELKDGIYFDYCGETLIGSLNFDGTNLNDEVEIIEEDKKIKRIQSHGADLFSASIGEWLHDKDNYTAYDELLMNKINEIIDYLNKENK